MFTPAEVAKNVIGIGKGKANLTPAKMIVLGIMAGMFIAFGAVAANTISCTVENASLAKFVGAAVFPVGLAMVLVGGAELFTGNSLMVIPLIEKEIKLSQMLKNWAFVYIGNLIGSCLVVLLANWGGQLNLFGGALAVTTIKVAAAKSSIGFGKAFVLGIACNFLVCMAVWMSFAARDIGGKMLILYMPIMGFVLCGFEHSVANMYYGIAGLYANMNPVYAAAAAESVSNIANLTGFNFFVLNLLPVTLGNVVGGGFVGIMYWFAYLRGQNK